MTRILLVDDHPMITRGLKYFLEQKAYQIADVCHNGIEALNLIMVKQPDVAIIDIALPGMSGIEILKKLKEINSPTKVIFYTMQNELSLFRHAVSLGVKGFVLKEMSNETLETCLSHVVNGFVYFQEDLESKMYSDGGVEHKENNIMALLTTTEKKILALVAKQITSKEIGKLLFICEKTVEVHRYNIIKKLNLPRGNNSLLLWTMRNY